MIIIRTLNSEYSIKAEGNRFRITKIANLPHGNLQEYLQTGDSRVTTKVDLEVGRAAFFDDWHTSTVLEVREAFTLNESGWEPHGSGQRDL